MEYLRQTQGTEEPTKSIDGLLQVAEKFNQFGFNPATIMPKKGAKLDGDYLMVDFHIGDYRISRSTVKKISDIASIFPDVSVTVELHTQGFEIGEKETYVKAADAVDISSLVGLDTSPETSIRLKAKVNGNGPLAAEDAVGSLYLLFLGIKENKVPRYSMTLHDGQGLYWRTREGIANIVKKYSPKNSIEFYDVETEKWLEITPDDVLALEQSTKSNPLKIGKGMSNNFVKMLDNSWIYSPQGKNEHDIEFRVTGQAQMEIVHAIDGLAHFRKGWKKTS
ncbi:MAG: hypothetical protein ABIJ08_07055 [Nanoarchaeota archaeon]